MKELFSLGKLYPSDFLKPDEQPRCEPVELKLVMEDNGLVHLEKTAPKEAMWGRYWYRSGINQTMKDELKNIVDSILKVFKFDEAGIWLDIACNDGTLLSFVPPHIFKVGFDPADDSYKNECKHRCDYLIQDFFSAKKYKEANRFRQQLSHPKVVTSIAMFYDLEKPEEFIKDVYEILDDDGLWVMQLSYTPLMLQQLEFSNICHEHLFYYGLLNIESLLNEAGFKLMDVTLNNTNAGSFRLYIMKEKGDETKFGTQTHRDVCEFRKRSLRLYEARMSYDDPAKWFGFFAKVNDLKKQTVDFIKAEKANGKTIYGYGASTKFNTVLQYFCLNQDMIDGIADRNPDKHGLRTVGSNIDIVSEETMRQAKPDYLLVGPAHFISEFMERERELLKSGTKFICIMPKFQII